MDNKPQAPAKKAVTPTPQELTEFQNELDALLKKRSLVFQPALRVTSSGITPELRIFKLVDNSPLKVPEEKPKTEIEKATS